MAGGAGKLSHVDEHGAARMVDVGDKPVTSREAVAECVVVMGAETKAAVERAALAKGDVLGVARVAGIMAAKKTSDLIPLCHPLPISSVEVDFESVPEGYRVTATARVSGQTGVEMEALTAAAVAGLTVIDMVKAVEKGVHLQQVRLVSKKGGKSGEWRR